MMLMRSLLVVVVIGVVNVRFIFWFCFRESVEGLMRSVLLVVVLRLLGVGVKVWVEFLEVLFMLLMWKVLVVDWLRVLLMEIL